MLSHSRWYKKTRSVHAKARALARIDAREQAQPKSETAFEFAPARKSIDLQKISAIELRELFAKGKFFRKLHTEGCSAPATLEEMDFHVTQNDIQNGTFSTDSAISKIEQEIRRRDLPMYWRVAGTKYVYVDQQGNVLRDLTDCVFMGEVDLPHLVPVPEPAPVKMNPKAQTGVTLTTPQKESREHWQNQHGSYLDYPKESEATEQPPVQPVPVRSLKFAYRLFDGTVFWPWGEVQTTPLPRETTLLGASDPPHYQQGSHIIGDYTLDEALFVWRRR